MPWLRIRGFRFGFFSYEPGNEPAHIHVRGKGGSAKLWLRPVRLIRSTYNESETSDIVRAAEQNEATLMEMWREHFGHR